MAAGDPRHPVSGDPDFERLFLLCQDLLCVASVDGYFKRVNPMFTEVLGYSEEELLARPFFDFLHRDERERARERFRALNEGVTIRDQENRYVCKDGSIRWLSWRSSAVQPDGLIYATARDVTDRRRVDAALRASEARWRSLVESPFDHVLLVNRELGVEFVNHPMPGMTDEDVRTRSLLEITPPEQRAALQAARRTVFEEGKAATYEAPAGDRWFAHFMAPISLGDEVVGASILAHDVTAQKRAEEDNRRLEAQMHQFQKMETIGTLAGGIAHDFNNILAPILGYTELALHETQDLPTVQDDLQQVCRAARRAKELVEQILVFSRQSDQERRPAPLHPSVQEGLSLVRASIRANVQLRQEIDESAGPVVANETQIQQVLLNLCANAGAAMGTDGGTLTVTLDRVQIDETRAGTPRNLVSGSWVRLAVADTGEGMPPHVLDRVYEPFFTTRGAGKGTGLGLAVVHGIVQAHAGVIRVESEVGSGTRFEVYLPAYRGSVEAAPPEAPEAPQGSGRALLVDDEPSVLRVGARILEHCGYEVESHTNPVRALESFERSPDGFDVIVTDQSMPDLSGLELIHRARALRPGFPVVLVTGYSEEVDRHRALEEGASAFLLKPYDLHELASALAQATARVSVGARSDPA